MGLTWPPSLPRALDVMCPLGSQRREPSAWRVPSSLAFLGYLFNLLIFKSSRSFVRIVKLEEGEGLESSKWVSVSQTLVTWGLMIWKG